MLCNLIDYQIKYEEINSSHSLRKFGFLRDISERGEIRDSFLIASTILLSATILERFRLSWFAIPPDWRLFRLSRFLDSQVSSSNAAVPRDHISHYFNSYGNSRGSAAMPARRKLSGQYEGQCQRGVYVGGGDGERGTGHTEVTVEGTNGATGSGGSRGRGSTVRMRYWIRPLATCLLSTMSDRWTGSHLLALWRNLWKFPALSWWTIVDERDRERERAPAGRARTVERALGVCSYEHCRWEHVPLVSTLVLYQSERESSVHEFFQGEIFFHSRYFQYLKHRCRN